MTPNKPLILFTGNTSFSMYNFRLGVMKALQNEGYRVAVAAPRDQYTALFADHHIGYYEIAMSRKGSNPAKEIRTLVDMIRLYTRLRPSMVFHYTIKPIIYGSVAAAASGIPSIAVTTGLGYAFVKSSFFSPAALAARLLYRFSLIFPRQVWFLNNDDRDIFVSRRIVKNKRTRVIPGEGVDTLHFAPAEKRAMNDSVRFLFIARLVEDKGIMHYVEAARILKGRAVFQILGPFDDYPNAVKPADVATWEQQGLISYLGTAMDVRSHIAHADCVVLPSCYREGVPRTLLEAASMGRPLVATSIPGCADVVADGINGFLCSPGDAHSLSAAMEKIISLTADERAAMGANGRARVKELFDETIIARIYSETVKNNLDV